MKISHLVILNVVQDNADIQGKAYMKFSISMQYITGHYKVFIITLFVEIKKI